MNESRSAPVGPSHARGAASARRHAGVRIVGTGSALPRRVLTNADLERMMDTSDEWIVQRTGIRERRIIDRRAGESTSKLSAEALRLALERARLTPGDLDLILVATMTAEMPAPGTAPLVANILGVRGVGAMDINGACSGFVYTMNIAHDLIRMGSYRTIGVIGADCLSSLLDYSTAGRGTAILFGDAAGAAVLRATDDPGKGILAQAMHADGCGWKEIYVPRCEHDFPEGVAPEAAKLNCVQMNGQGVFRFAVTTFCDLIQETLDKAGIRADEVAQYVCHQSNGRILESARKRFDIPHERLYVNIDRYGNTVGASVPLCFDELVRSGRAREGDRVMFVAFGAGLTWASSLWQL